MADLPLSPDDVAEIVAILDSTPYQRIDIRTKRFNLSVARSGAGWTQSWEWPQGASQGSAEGASPVSEGAAASQNAALHETAAVDGSVAVRALLPGSFYRSPQPGATPFVELGSIVEPGTVVGIIETMKLMTPVHAGVAGMVVAILADNAVPVDAQAILMRVKPAAP
jgi:acetyl-CoA carboxylase biotin carboxyl carrier protein